jgi:predicted RNase H-like HicB family nuclease
MSNKVDVRTAFFVHEDSGEFRMDSKYTAIIQRDGPWWVGWIKEIPGVNSQARTRSELIKSLQSALEEALEMNRAEAVKAAVGEYEEVPLGV